MPLSLVLQVILVCLWRKGQHSVSSLARGGLSLACVPMLSDRRWARFGEAIDDRLWTGRQVMLIARSSGMIARAVIPTMAPAGITGL